jgi:hypothetical protein
MSRITVVLDKGSGVIDHTVKTLLLQYGMSDQQVSPLDPEAHTVLRQLIEAANTTYISDDWKLSIAQFEELVEAGFRRFRFGGDDQEQVWIVYNEKGAVYIAFMQLGDDCSWDSLTAQGFLHEHLNAPDENMSIAAYFKQRLLKTWFHGDVRFTRAHFMEQVRWFGTKLV